MRSKIVEVGDALRWRLSHGRVVFTNGVFDLLHPGHVDLLTAARAEGDALIVGLNTDASVRRLKGPSRPIRNERDRAHVLAALSAVDRVVLFDDDTPLRLIEALAPDVLVKGGDYTWCDVVGCDFVHDRGGRVVLVPLTEGHSTTSTVAGMGQSPLTELAELATVSAESLRLDIEVATDMVRETLKAGGTLYFCGNGGSAADAQHIAAEYVVRFRRNRKPYRAIALTVDTSVLTACGNDLGFDELFARQVEALCRPGDLLIVHTTSGMSPNILKAVEQANRMGVASLVLTSNDGGRVRELASHTITIPTKNTARAQEIHLCIQHAICAAIDEATPETPTN